MEDTFSKINNVKNDFNQELIKNFEETKETNSFLANELDNLKKLKEEESSKNSELELLVKQLSLKLQNEIKRNKELESEVEQYETLKAEKEILEREVKKKYFS